MNEIIHLKQISKECPEQYHLYNNKGDIVGYIRVRYGYCTAWYPNEDSDDCVYKARVKNGWWKFPNSGERKKHLQKIASVIIQRLNSIS